LLLTAVYGSAISSRIGVKFGGNIPYSSKKYTLIDSQIFDLTSHIKDGGHGVLPPGE